MALLILVMMILERLFRTRKLVPDESEPGETETVSRHARDTTDEEVAAAIALALAHLRLLDLSRSGLGTALETGRGAWWTVGQIRPRPVNVALPPLKALAPSEVSDTPQERD
jgi:Na+-transporting methylmalonyl-CoA/oxaloacetate decarboxylase gamma subunit